MIHDLELVFMVFYAVASCGVAVLNLLNMQYEQSFNIALIQATVSLVLVFTLEESQYRHVYNYIAILSCFISVIIALFGGNKK